MGAAVALLAGMAFVAQRIISTWGGEAPDITKGEERQRKGKVYVAVKRIPARTVLTEEMMEETAIPKAGISSDDVTKPGDVVGYITKAPIREGGPMRWSLLAGHVDQIGLPAIIPSGHRAMVVKMGPEPSLHHLIKPGDSVDITVTLDSDYAKVVLEDIEVLAVDHAVAGEEAARPTQTAGDTGESGGRRRPRRGATEATDQQSVTLAVTPVEAEQLALCNSSGRATIEYSLHER